MRVCLISLGCAKNLVDGETMLGLLGVAGHEFASRPADADAVIVNTCAFIRPAQRESVERILEVAAGKKDGRPLIIVAGCLAQASGRELIAEIPEVDAVVGTGSAGRIAAIIERATRGVRTVCIEPPGYLPDVAPPRLLSTPPWTAYLKISEGCSNRCRYCLIPSLRGPGRSRPPERVLDEAGALLDCGAREIVLIGQDLTRYGDDLRDGTGLKDLLRSASALPGDFWLRLQYLHPARVGPELLEVIAGEPKICRYLDLPMQHGDDQVLAAMGRGVTAGEMLATVDAARARIPGVAVRTTLMTGHPGETRPAFRNLLRFMRRAACDWGAVFAFSRQEGTPAARMPDQVPPRTRIARRARAMAVQRRISRTVQTAHVGKGFRMLVETLPHEVTVPGSGPAQAVSGRTYREAAGIDGQVHLLLDGEAGTAAAPAPGTFVVVQAVAAEPYDLFAIPEQTPKGK